MKTTHELKGKFALRWLAVHEQAQQVYVDAGFPRLVGTPVGHLFDIPAIADEAARIADRERTRGVKPGQPPPDVHWEIFLRQGKIMVDVSVRAVR
jgi:hypothetical protein